MRRDAGRMLGKPLEIEELVDLHIHRPLAKRVVSRLAATRVTPNQVTIFSGVLGVAAGIVLIFGATRPFLRPIGGALLLLSAVFDCADGQLARLRGTSSTTGAILDGVADYFVGFFTFFGATWVAVKVHGDLRFLWLGAAAMAFSALQCALYDHVKNQYVARVRLSFKDREKDVAHVQALRARARDEQRWGDALLLWVYDKYMRAQNAALTDADAGDPETYRRANRARMRGWTWLGIGTHLCLLYVAAAISIFWPAALTVALVAFCTAMNALFFGLLALEAMARTRRARARATR